MASEGNSLYPVRLPPDEEAAAKGIVRELGLSGVQALFRALLRRAVRSAALRASLTPPPRVKPGRKPKRPPS